MFLSELPVASFVFKSPKMTQRTRGTKVQLGRLPGSEVCPVQALEVYRQGSVSLIGPLFQPADGTTLTVFQFRSIFHWALLSMGYSASNNGLHSLHIGAA